uniref:GH16 domain-containing protein n=1 Tax=Acrobeloides nanus TaxID=290746 RepID=A0A914DB93_9BILA
MTAKKFFVSFIIFLYLNTNVLGQSGCPTTYSNTAIKANVISTAAGSVDSCCALCQQNSACAAYKWNSTSGGTCFLLDDYQPLYVSNGETVGVTTPSSANAYVLTKSYDSSNWLNDDTFSYANSNGDFTVYVDKNTATSKGLVKTQNGKVYVGMDNTTVLPWNDTSVKGRDAVRLNSISTYNAGLFILNLDHMPTGPGVLTEFWMSGPNWPNEGEIDILQGPANKNFNTITLHTDEGCTMQVSDNIYFTGSWEIQNNKPGANCWNNAPGQYAYAGCGIEAPNNTFNTGFNQAGGGVFAMEWNREKFIRIWNFVQPNVPADIVQNNPSPNPATWGMPTAYFTIGPNCTADHFQTQTMTLMVDLCPSWGYFPGGACECHNHASFAPYEYSEAYWLINYLKVFCKNGQNCISS